MFKAIAGRFLPAKLEFLLASGFNLCGAFRGVYYTQPQYTPYFMMLSEEWIILSNCVLYTSSTQYNIKRY